VIGIVLVQLGGAILRAEWTEQQLAWALEAALEHGSGERAVVGGLEILPSQARVELHGLVLSHRSDDPEHDGMTVLAVDQISVQFRPKSGGPWVGQVEVHKPVLRLHLDSDGLREFREVTEASVDAFPWSTLSLTDGTVVLDVPDGQVRGTGITIASVEDQDDRYDVWLDELAWSHGGMEQRDLGVRLLAVQATPERLVLPQINLQTEALSLSGDLAAIVDGPLGGNLSLSMSLPALDALVTPPTRLEGDAYLDIDLSGTMSEPVAEGSALLTDLLVHHVNHSGNSVQYQVPRARLGWRASDGVVQVVDGRVDWGGGQLSVDGRLELDTSAVEAAISLENLSLAEAIRQASGPADAWTSFTGDGEVDVHGTLRPLALAGGFDLALIDVVVDNGPLRAGRSERLIAVPKVRLRGDLEVDSEAIRIHAKDFVAGATSGEVDARVGFHWYGPLDIQVDLDRTNLSTFRPLKGLDLRGHGQVHGRIHGPFDAIQYTANTRLADFSMLGIGFADQVQARFECSDSRTLEFTDVRALTGQTPYQGSVRFDTKDPDLGIDLEITEGRIVDILAMVDVDVGIVDGDVRGSIALAGDPSALDGDVVLQLQSVDLLGERFAGGELYSWMDGGRATLETLSLARWNGEEGVMVRGTIGSGWRTNLDVVATGFRVQRLDALGRLDLPIQGRLSVDARIGGTLMAPEPHGRIAVRDSWFSGYEVPDSTVYFDTTGGLMQLEGHLLGKGMSFEGSIEMGQEGNYRAVARLDRFPLHTVLPAAVDGTLVEAWLSGSVKSEGALAGAERFARVDARGTGLDFDWERHHLRAVAPWTFRLDGKRLALEGLKISGGDTKLHLDGKTQADGRVHWRGGGQLDLDLARLGVTGLQRADGTGVLRVETGQSETGLVVDMATCGATVKGTWFPHPVADLRGVIRATRGGYSLRVLDPGGTDAAWWAASEGLRRCAERLPEQPQLAAETGGGGAEIEGRISAVRWVPTYFDLTGKLSDGRIRYFDFLPSAVGDVELSFNGSVGKDLLLSGQIDIREMMFGQRIEWEDWLLAVSDEWQDSSVSAEKDPLFAMDLKIAAKDTVRMRNNVADMTASGELRIVGDTARPGLIGSIRAQPGGRIHLKEREFELERGELRFVDPLTYDPDVDIVLRTDVRTREQNYDVEYRVLGTYEDWRAETSSEPVLSSADINALLLFGMTKDELERYGGLGGVLAVEGGDLLASKVFLSGGLGKERGGLFSIVEPLSPDRLDLVSGVSERGSGILSSDLRLLYENELDDLRLPGTLMIFEQNLTRVSDTYLGLEQRLARTLFARTYWASEQHGRHLAIGGAYGLEMKVRWELD